MVLVMLAVASLQYFGSRWIVSSTLGGSGLCAVLVFGAVWPAAWGAHQRWLLSLGVFSLVSGVYLVLPSAGPWVPSTP